MMISIMVKWMMVVMTKMMIRMMIMVNCQLSQSYHNTFTLIETFYYRAVLSIGKA